MPITYDDGVQHIEQHIEQYEEEEIQNITERRYTTHMPDLEDTDAVQQWLQDLEAHKEVFGVKKLLYSIQMVLEHQRLKEQHFQTACKALHIVNGIRTSAQRQADRGKSLETTARRFYNSLNATGLRLQCQLFRLDYDAFNCDIEGYEGVVEALVAKHMEMQAA